MCYEVRDFALLQGTFESTNFIILIDIKRAELVGMSYVTSESFDDYKSKYERGIIFYQSCRDSEHVYEQEFLDQIQYLCPAFSEVNLENLFYNITQIKRTSSEAALYLGGLAHDLEAMDIE